MRHPRSATASPAAPARQLPPPVTFICTGCDAVEHRRTSALPEHWTTLDVGSDIHAFCGECSERRERPTPGTWQ